MRPIFVFKGSVLVFERLLSFNGNIDGPDEEYRNRKSPNLVGWIGAD